MQYGIFFHVYISDKELELNQGCIHMDDDKDRIPDLSELNMTDEELLDEFECAKRIICDGIPVAPPGEFEIIWKRIQEEEEESKK